MAEVLSPMFPHNDPNKTVHSRTSSSDAFQSQPSSQTSRLAHMPRNTFGNGYPSGPGYRGTSQAPVAPYAFKSTPHLRNDNRMPSASHSNSYTTQALSADNGSAANRQRYPPTSSVSTTSSSSSSAPSTTWGQQMFSKDDSVLSSSFKIAPFTTESFGDMYDLKSSVGNGHAGNSDPLNRSAPDRYRRTHRKSEGHLPAMQAQPQSHATPSQGFQKMGQFSYNVQQQPRLPQNNASTGLVRPELGSIEIPTASGRRVNLENGASGRSPSGDSPKRYRRKAAPGEHPESGRPQTPTSGVDTRPNMTFDAPNGFASRPRANSAQQETRPVSANNHRHSSSLPKNEAPPSPSSTHDTNKRITNPSPLSRPMSSSNESQTAASKSPPVQPSPAVAAMAALNDKEAQKGMKSRLRRAFSFGASAELKRAADGKEDAAEKAKARQQAFSNELDEELDEEQRAIAEKQEAMGLGNSIYSGQGNIFTGSTDNLSISSTASSASMMLRKMGRGMKKGGKSLKSMFRPKSVIGVPPADAPMAASSVTMVTVEAEREKVNVNANPHDQAGGGTGFPRLERNSVEMGRVSLTNDDGHGDKKDTRKSVVSGDQERQEILAVVRRGILKRSTTASPTMGTRPEDMRKDLSPPVFERGSPSPGSPANDRRRSGHRRTDSHTLEGDDYFAVLPRLPGANVSSRSLPDAPRSANRNISFSPRIQFHDVWSSSDYDRRGDIATCNRLTPMLAQQIKEELNTFKMEMEVHEMSKPYTHFF